jgi:hypothetical protein
VICEYRINTNTGIISASKFTRNLIFYLTRTNSEKISVLTSKQEELQ